MVLWISLAIIAAFVLWGLTGPESLNSVSSSALAFATADFGWFYMLSALVFLVFCLYLAFSKYGRIPLGRDDEDPEFSTASWFSMLFSAGMGIGLVFYGVAEPMSHFARPPAGIEGGTNEAARAAFQYTFFHWGLHPWAIYSVVALAIAYFGFRKNDKTLVSSTFRPLIGKWVDRWPGKAIDIFSILATIFGVATTLGFGAAQIASGGNFLLGLENTQTLQLGIIAAVTVLFMISAATGLGKGIQILSNLNIGLAGLLFLAVAVIGPTVFLLDVFTTSLGAYLQNLIGMSTSLSPFSGDSWVRDWSVFYWAWWIAWAPFVGLFIARISRGRTIREFLTGVLIVPSLVCFLWFSVFGGTAIFQDMQGLGSIAQATAADTSTAMFALLETLPWGGVLAVIATLLVTSFFITSADSATFVLGMLSTDGNQNPPMGIKLAWGAAQSLIAVALLVSGGLSGLQSATITAALPFTVIMLAMCVSLLRALANDPLVRRTSRAQPFLEQPLPEPAPVAGTSLAPEGRSTSKAD